MGERTNEREFIGPNSAYGRGPKMIPIAIKSKHAGNVSKPRDQNLVLYGTMTNKNTEKYSDKIFLIKTELKKGFHSLLSQNMHELFILRQFLQFCRSIRK